MQDKVEAFRNNKLFSKEEIIQSFKLSIEHISSNNESNLTKTSKAMGLSFRQVIF